MSAIEWPKLLRSRRAAAAAAAAVVVFGTLFGVHRSVGAEAARIEKMFYEGVYLSEARYTERSIQYQLDARSQAALGLYTLAADAGGDEVRRLADELLASRRELVDSKDIAGKYRANEKLQEDFEALRVALAEAGLSDQARAAFEKYSSQFDGAQKAIEMSAYNGEVRSFVEGALETFPVKYIKEIAFVRYPEYFGAEGE